MRLQLLIDLQADLDDALHVPAQLVHLVVLAPARSLGLELATPASRARARLRQRAGWAPAVPTTTWTSQPETTAVRRGGA